MIIGKNYIEVEESISKAFDNMKLAHFNILNELKLFDSELYLSIQSILDSDPSNTPFFCKNFCSRIKKFALNCNIQKLEQAYLKLGLALQTRFSSKDLQIALRFSTEFINLATFFSQVQGGLLKNTNFSSFIKREEVIVDILYRSKIEYVDFLNEVHLEDKILNNFLRSVYSLEMGDVIFSENIVERFKSFCQLHDDRVFFSYAHMLWANEAKLFCPDEMIILSGVFGKYRSLNYTITTILDPPFKITETKRLK